MGRWQPTGCMGTGVAEDALRKGLDNSSHVDDRMINRWSKPLRQVTRVRRPSPIWGRRAKAPEKEIRER